MASKELQVALKLLAQTSEFQAEIARASQAVAELGEGSASASDEAASAFGVAQEAAGGLESALESATKAAFTFAAGFVGLQTAQQLLAIADSAANMQAKLTLATSSQEELAAATKATFEIAQATSTGLDATVTLYARLSSSLKDLGTSQADIVGLTQTINQALAVSGATAEETSSAVLQLSQAFASGKLGGEEFGAVNESGGRIMTALAAALDVPRGKLKELAEQGRLTSQVIAAALKEQAATIASEAAKLPLTFERAVIQLDNAFIKMIGGIDASTDVSGKLALAVQSLANDFANGTGAAGALGKILVFLASNIDLIAGAIKTGTIVFGGYFLIFTALPAAIALAQAALAAVIFKVWALQAAMQQGILTGLTYQTALVGAAQAAFVGFAVYNIGTLLYEQFQVVRDGGTYIVFTLLEGWNKLKTGTQIAFYALAEAIDKSLAFIRGKIADTIDGFVTLTQFDLGFLDLRADFSFGAGDALTQVAAALRDASEAGAGFATELASVGDAYNKTGADNDAFLADQLNLNASYDANAAAAAAQAAAQAELGTATGKTAKEILAETAANGKGTDAKKASTAATRAQAKALEESTRIQLALLAESVQGNADFNQISEDLAAQIGGPSAQANLEFARTMLAIEAAFAAVQKAGPPTAAQFEQLAQSELNARKKLNTQLAEIAQSDPINQAAKQQADEFVRTWNQAGSSASDAFADSLLNGFSGLGDSLKNIWKNLIKQMLSAQIEKSLFAPFIAQIQGALGGVLSGKGNAGGGLGGILSSLFGSGSESGSSQSGGPGAGGLGGLLNNVFGGSAGAVLAGAAIAGGFARALGGNGTGAAIGALIAGPIGAIIGGAFGGSKKPTGQTGASFNFGANGVSGNNVTQFSQQRSFYRGTRRFDQISALTADQTSGLQEIQAAAAAVGRATAAAVGRAFVGVVAAEFKTTVDKDGKVLSQIGRALGAEYKVSLDEFARVISAETAIAQLPAVASQIAQKFRGSVDSIVDASQFLVTAQAQISAGQGLFTGDNALQSAADAVKRLGTEGETLLQSYTRISGATALYDQALALIGQTTKLARDAAVDFATGVASAAGGLDQATALYQRFFAVAYSEQERGLAQLAQAEGRRNTLLAQAGLSAGTTIATLRASIEQLLRTGADPAKLVLLLQAVDAIQNVADATAQLGDASALYEQALAATGQTTNLSRTAILQFSNGMAAAAGGLDKATALYDRFFQAAYTEQEQGLAQLTQAEARRNTLLAQAGLGADTTLASLRKSIEELLISGADPAKLVLLLQVAGAFQDLADALKDSLASVEQFASTLDTRFRDLGRVGFTDFERSLLSIDDQLQQDVAQLQATRREMVARGATTAQLAAVDRQLARAHQFAAQAAVQAINQLRAQGRALIAQLRSGRTNYAEQQAQSFADAGAQAFQDIGQAAQQAYEAQLAGIKSIQEYLDGQLLGNLSSLTPEQRLAEAQAQFNRALLAAQGGDADALRRLTQLADAVLREGRAFDPSSFPDLEASIRAALQALVTAGPTIRPPVDPVGGPVGGPAAGAAAGAAGAIDNSAKDFAASQAELSLQIAAIIRQLIGATGDTLAEVAATLGLNITELVSALGINLGALTAGSVQSLGTLANSLGVELTDLAGEVGVSLGDLADEQSLLNDALEAEIAALPQSQRDQLQPLLDAVEASANNPEGLAIAQAALEAKIIEIGGDAANKLAPYFDNIDPIDPLLSIDSALRAGFGNVVTATNAVVTAIRTIQPIAPPRPSFAVGTSFVPHDMLANIHEGEAVIDADSMRVLRQYGVRVVTPQGGGDGVNTGALIGELRQLRTEVQTLRATVARGDERNVLATVGAAELQSAASDRIARAQNQGRRVMS